MAPLNGVALALALWIGGSVFIASLIYWSLSGPLPPEIDD